MLKATSSDGLSLKTVSFPIIKAKQNIRLIVEDPLLCNMPRFIDMKRIS